jgi:branched-chain amino acid transport system ATP-binding protein
MTGPILSGRGITVRFGGLQALVGVDFEIHSGEVLGVIGPNGAGKSVLINAVTKLYSLASGSLELEGIDITGYSPTRTARVGLARTFQNIRLFKRLSVLENVLVADPRYSKSPFMSLMRSSGASVSDAHDLLTLMKLQDHADMPASSLSYGQARRLEIARALATKPKIILLDEPAAGMNEAETLQLIDDIETLRSKVSGIMLIEHDMALIRALATRLIALDAGRKICDGPVETVLNHASVQVSYLGNVA